MAAPVGLGSSGAVYNNAREPDGVNREDQRLSTSGGGPTGTWKKTFEIIGNYYKDRTGMDVVAKIQKRDMLKRAYLKDEAAKS